MKYIIKTLLFSMILVSVPIWAAPMMGPTLTLLPNEISGAPSSTIGWGFTITNTMNFLEVTSSQFCLNPVSFPACTLSMLGTYTDIIGFEPAPVIVGPPPESPAVTQMFNLSPMRGVGSFHINANAPVGAMDQGQIVLTYDLFRRSPNDPNFNPDTDTISTDNLLSANASVHVVPEPATVGLMGLSLIALAGVRLRRRA